jgi:hypothetical protein
MGTELMNWEYLTKFREFLNYISSEPELPVALTQVWDDYYKSTIKLLEFGRSKGIEKETCELYLKLPKPQMYDIVRMDFDILQPGVSLFFLLIISYQDHYFEERKKYLFNLRIADMTEREYGDLVKIITLIEEEKRVPPIL